MHAHVNLHLQGSLHDASILTAMSKAKAIWIAVFGSPLAVQLETNPKRSLMSMPTSSLAKIFFPSLPDSMTRWGLCAVLVYTHLITEALSLLNKVGSLGC